MKVVLKRMDGLGELIETGEDFDMFCRQQFFENSSSDGRLNITTGNGDRYMMYIGCEMQGNLGDEHFYLLRPEERIPDMQKQLIYGNTIFVKYELDDQWEPYYVDISEEEAEAINGAFEPLGMINFVNVIEALHLDLMVNKLDEL